MWSPDGEVRTDSWAPFFYEILTYGHTSTDLLVKTHIHQHRGDIRCHVEDLPSEKESKESVFSVCLDDDDNDEDEDDRNFHFLLFFILIRPTYSSTFYMILFMITWFINYNNNKIWNGVKAPNIFFS